VKHVEGGAACDGDVVDIFSRNVEPAAQRHRRKVIASRVQVLAPPGAKLLRSSAHISSAAVAASGRASGRQVGGQPGPTLSRGCCMS
jgi:hypothetical protein